MHQKSQLNQASWNRTVFKFLAQKINWTSIIIFQQGRRKEGACLVWGIALCPYKRGATEAVVPFWQQYRKQFHGLSRTIWNKIVAAIRAPRKFRRVFYNSSYYFWVNIVSETEISVIGNDFFVFYTFKLPCPIAAPASLPFKPFLLFSLDRTIWKVSRHYQFGWVLDVHLF